MPIPPPAEPVPAVHRGPATVLAWMLFLLPTVGVPSELMLQDTLKSAVAAFGILGAALLFFWQKRQRNTPVQWHGLVWLPLVLMAYALGSMAWSHTYLAGVETVRWFLLALLLWLSLNTFTRENLPTLLLGIHAGAVVASLWAALQFWFNLTLFPQGAFPASTFINRNFFAEYLVCTLPFSAYLLASTRSTRSALLLATTLAFNVVALMMTGTRSALIALWLITPVLLFIGARYRAELAFRQWGRAGRVVVSAVLLFGVWGLGSVPSDNPQVLTEHTGNTPLQRSLSRTASMAKPAEYTEGSFSIRSQMWMATARMMLANPLTGVGAGAWEVQIPLYQRTYTTLETDYYAHNEFLQLLSEYGLPVGGLVLAILFAYLLLAAESTWRLQGPAQQEAPLRAIALTSLLALGIVSNAGFPLHLAACGVLFAVCLAILARTDSSINHQSAFRLTRFTLSTRIARSLFIVAACGLIGAAAITWQAQRAEFSLVSAIRTANAFNRAQRMGDPQEAQLKTQALAYVREGVAINPHYRKLTGEVAEAFAASGDWGNAVWILESVAASRPHVAALWTGLAQGYSALGQRARAQTAFEQLQVLKPTALSTLALHATLLSEEGDAAAATALLTTQLDSAVFDFELLQAAYAIGYKNKNWALAIRALELRNTTWPETRTDGYLRLGKLYAEPGVDNPQKAITAFKAGLASVPIEQRSNYISQVPVPYRTQM